MKCPYRKNIIKDFSIVCDGGRQKSIDSEEFADCHKEECPFYFATAESCKRVEVLLSLNLEVQDDADSD